MTEIRPGNRQAPSQPPLHRLPAQDNARHGAAFAEGEVPGHRHPRLPGSLITPEAIERVVQAMDSLNVAVLVRADNLSGRA